MQKVLCSSVIDQPVERLWSVARDFNAHGEWHPAIARSTIERSEASDRVGCIRRFQLADGQELREQLLHLSDLEMSYSYCLLDTPVPLFNYIAHFRVFPVTDGDRSYCEWEGRFDTRLGEEAAMRELVSEGIYMTGFRALADYLKNNA